MIVVPRAMPSALLAASLRPEPVEAPAAGPADLKNDWFSNGRLLLDKLDPLALSRYLIAFFIGVAATIVWQSHIGPAAQAIASAFSPPQQQINAILLDTVRRSIDRLAVGQEQIALEIGKLQAVQFTPYQNAELSPVSAPAPAAYPILRPSQAPIEADAQPDWRRQPCCQWPGSSTR